MIERAAVQIDKWREWFTPERMARLNHIRGRAGANEFDNEMAASHMAHMTEKEQQMIIDLVDDPVALAMAAAQSREIREE